MKGLKTVNELASQFQGYPTPISHGQRQVQAGARELFGPGRATGERGHETVQANLYEEVGRLKMELDWMKKTAGLR